MKKKVDKASKSEARKGIQDVETGTGKRATMDETAYASVNAPGNTNPKLLIAKKGHARAGGDPSMGTAGGRGQVMQERMGPRFAVNVPSSLGPLSPEAGQTQANGRIIRSTVGRTDRENFDAASEHYI